MQCLNTEMALDRVSTPRDYVSGDKAKRRGKLNKKAQILDKKTKLVFGATVLTVALATGFIQYKEARTNVAFDTSLIGVSLEETSNNIRNIRQNYVEANMNKIEEVSQRNEMVAGEVLASMTAYGPKTVASSYVKVSPNNMVNAKAIDVGGKLKTEELNELGEVISTEVQEVQEIEESQQVQVEEVPGPLLDIANPDANYTGTVISITGQNRANLESLVFNEAGDQGFIGACLVAQVIRDEMIDSGVRDAWTIKKRFGYEAAINGKTNSDAKQAVAYIFDHGGMAVKHRIYYFYAPRLVRSSWHESQNFIVEYKGHRVFDKR